MVCFQIYFLRYLRQRWNYLRSKTRCCGLLSDLFFTIFATASLWNGQQAFRLWFAFRFIFYDICNSRMIFFEKGVTVVICFQIYFLRYLQQPYREAPQNRFVVICFQIYFLRYLQQLELKKHLDYVGCDLLSDLFFTIFATATPLSKRYTRSLWFAFRFIFYDICNSSFLVRNRTVSVVICFQIYFLRYLQQHHLFFSISKPVVICFQIYFLRYLQQHEFFKH